MRKMTDTKDGDREPVGLRPLVCIMVFLTGFVSFGYEVVMQAEALIYLGSSNIAMGIVISMFILGYLSSILFGIWADRLRNTGSRVILFLSIEIIVGLIIIFMGDILRTAPVLADLFSAIPVIGLLSRYTFLLIFVSLMAIIVPALMGGELPIAMKILSGISPDAYDEIGKTTGTLFTLDSLGSALGGVVTSVFLLEALGKSATSLFVGLLSLFVVLLFGSMYTAVKRGVVGKVATMLSRSPARFIRPIGRAAGRYKGWIIFAAVLGTVISTIIVNVAPIKYGAQQDMYEGIVVYYEETPFNTIAVTKHIELELSFFQNRKLVISEKDHFQQYEPMVHVPMNSLQSPERVLILGGGNGGALSEVLKYPSVTEVVVVERDPAMVEVSRKYFSKVLGSPFDDTRVSVNHSYPRDYLDSQSDDVVSEEAGGSTFDCIIIDLQEPRTDEMAMNYTGEFYQNVSRALSKEGIVVSHASSPIITPETAVVVRNTMEMVFGSSLLFGTDIWSTGPYLFCMASKTASSLHMNASRIGENYATLTSSTRLYTPANHEAFLLQARTNVILGLMENRTVSSDKVPFIETLGNK